jgi:hypothetical protein
LAAEDGLVVDGDLWQSGREDEQRLNPLLRLGAVLVEVMTFCGSWTRLSSFREFSKDWVRWFQRHG